MKEFRGTKGEWKKFDIVNHAQYHTYFKVSNSQTEDSRGGTSICNVTTRNEEQAEANARLIASAPELLKALQRWVKFAEQQNLDYESSMVRESKAAINKALGE